MLVNTVRIAKFMEESLGKFQSFERREISNSMLTRSIDIVCWNDVRLEVCLTHEDGKIFKDINVSFGDEQAMLSCSGLHAWGESELIKNLVVKLHCERFEGLWPECDLKTTDLSLELREEVKKVFAARRVAKRLAKS